MEITFLERFVKDLKNISDKAVKNDVEEVISSVENAKAPSDIKNLKKMKGARNAFRIKIGDYRIGIYIEKGNVEFARVLHRKEVYKYFP
jgi:mRNA interferase RelE/StbE